MLYKVGKHSGKGAEEWKNLKKTPRVVNNEKNSRTKPNGEPPASLEAFNHCEKTPDYPQVKLKLLELTPENSEQETSAGMQQPVRHTTSILGDKKCPLRNENLRANGSCSVQNVDKHKNKSFEKLTRSNDACINKNPKEKTKTQKADTSKKHLGLKSKSYISEFPEKKTDRKIVGTTPEKNRNYDFQDGKKKSPERKCVDDSKKEVSKSQSAVGPVNKRRRSEIPLLRTRQVPEKKIEVVSLMTQKTLRGNDSTTSVDLCQDTAPMDEFSATSELEIILRADENSSQSDEIGEIDNLRLSTRRVSETPEDPLTFLKSSNVPLDSNISSDHAVTEKKTVRASKAKTLDLEKVKTSSFTVLRAEGDNFNRLESFHQQNITARETARAEIASKTSKILLMASKASFSSINPKKSLPASGADIGYKSNSKKTKAIKNESQEINFQKNSGPKILETPHLDLFKETKGTVKAGCLIPKRVADEKKNNNVSPEKKSPSLHNVAESEEKTERKIIPKGPVKEKECSRKNRIHQNSEEALIIQAPPVTVENKLVELAKDTLEGSAVETTETCVIERPLKNVDATHENKLGEIPDEEIKLTPRELASLVVTGTALNFDDMEIFEKPPEINKIKLEIKIDVPSEEEVTDCDATECESNGNVSGATFDWLLMSKIRNCEKQNYEPPYQNDKTSEEKLSSLHCLAEQLKTGECPCDETVLSGAHRSLPSVKRRPHFTKTLINMNRIEKKSGFESDDRWSFSGDPYNCSMFLQNKRRDTVSFTKVRSGLTKSCNREEKIFDDPTSLKLRRRNSEPYSLRGFIWKRADITSPKSLKPSVSSVASSLRHLNTDDLDDFIFWEVVPQKLTSCWEMSLYHFKRPWSVLSFSVFKDNRRSKTPGLILDTLRSGGVTNIRPSLLYQNDKINRCKGNIFDVEPSISQKNIDIRNWLAALNFTTPISNATDVVTESIFSVPPVSDTQKQTNHKRRNVMPQFRLVDKVPEKKLYNKVKNHKFDKWNISDMKDLKELIRKESGSYVTKEQYILSELSNLRSTAIANACIYTSSSEKEILKETDNQDLGKEVKSVETSCQSEPSEAQDQLKLKGTPDSSSASLKSEMVNLPPEINIWKYLFLFTLMFIIFHYSLGSNFVIRS